MAKYPKMVVTKEGLSMIAESHGGAGLIFTKVQLGKGELSGSIMDLTACIDPRLDINITDIDATTKQGQVTLTAIVNNSQVEIGFYAKELSVWAKIGADGTERLYAYTNAGNYADYIPDKSEPTDENILKPAFVIANAENITAVIDESIVYPTVEQMERAIEKHDDSANAHMGIAYNMLKRDCAYTKGDIVYCDRLPLWAVLECVTSGTTATACTLPTINVIGKQIEDGSTVWRVRHKGVQQNIGDIWLYSGAFNADGFPIHNVTGLTMLDCHICDGTNNTPDLINRFVMGAAVFDVNKTGGNNEKTLNIENIPAHDHTGTIEEAGEHNHVATAWTDAQGAHTHLLSGVKQALNSGTQAGSSGAELSTLGGGAEPSVSTAGNHAHNVGVTVANNGKHHHDFTIGESGEGKAFDNRPAYYTLAFIKKIF